MSERQLENYIGFLKSAVIALLGICLVISFYWGKTQRIEGRAEQKKWDAGWYAAHPVVKEVPLVSPRLDCIVVHGNNWFEEIPCPPNIAIAPPAPKPQKGKLACSVLLKPADAGCKFVPIGTIARFDGYDWKPQKGSKRRMNNVYWEGGPIEGVFSPHAQPIPEKEQ